MGVFVPWDGGPEGGCGVPRPGQEPTRDALIITSLRVQFSSL